MHPPLRRALGRTRVAGILVFFTVLIHLMSLGGRFAVLSRPNKTHLFSHPLASTEPLHFRRFAPVQARAKNA